MSKRSEPINLAAKFLVAAVVVGVMAVAGNFGPTAAAKGQEVGVVCTGTEMIAGTCEPAPLQSTPIGAIPLGCKPTSPATIACGRRGSHLPDP